MIAPSGVAKWDGRKTRVPRRCMACGQEHNIIPGSGGFYIEPNERGEMNHDCVIAMRQACWDSWTEVITNLYGVPGREFPNSPVMVASERNWREDTILPIRGFDYRPGMGPSGVLE